MLSIQIERLLKLLKRIVAFWFNTALAIVVIGIMLLVFYILGAIVISGCYTNYCP